VKGRKSQGKRSLERNKKAALGHGCRGNDARVPVKEKGDNKVERGDIEIFSKGKLENGLKKAVQRNKDRNGGGKNIPKRKNEQRVTQKRHEGEKNQAAFFLQSLISRKDEDDELYCKRHKTPEVLRSFGEE